MGGFHNRSEDINYLPYIECVNSVSKEVVKLLIDTGSNKNIIRQGRIPTSYIDQGKTIMKNITGEHHVMKKGSANFLGNGLPLQTYFELDFHDFFDGIIGSEYFAKKNRAIVSYDKETLFLKGISLPFLKYYPPQKLFNHLVTINTLPFQNKCRTSNIKAFVHA